MMRQPVLVLTQNTKRETGRTAQLGNIRAGRAIADIVQSTLGPKSMLKMLLDPMGGIVLTNDGNAILREVDVSHPGAKSVIELSRAQDEEAGDGTTSVVILAGELLSLTEPFLLRDIHPSVIVTGYLKALDDALTIMADLAHNLDPNNMEVLIAALDSCLDSKFSSSWAKTISRLALEAAKTVTIKHPGGRKEIDIKKYARVEKIPGGEWEDSCVLRGVMLNKDVVHNKMPRRVANPKVCLLDCTLEYKKGESQTSVELTKEEDFARLLQQEEDEVKKMCDEVIASGANVCVTEKGVSDLAAHFLMKGGISTIRRAKKTDNNRLARATGATIVNRTEELTSADIGHNCGLFEVKKIGDEYFAHFVECEDPKACTIVLRGASKDVLNEVERNLLDAMYVARNILLHPKLLPGGGAVEMEVAARLKEKAETIVGPEALPYRALAAALEVIPRTLVQNCGANVVRTMTNLRARHAEGGKGANIGIDGTTGEITDVTKLSIWDTYTVKEQVIKTAVEATAMLVRIDDVLSGVGKQHGGGPKGSAPGMDPETGLPDL